MHRNPQKCVFFFLYSLANFGGCLAFVPLLTLIVPQKVESFGVENSISTISWLLLVGACTASAFNIIAGFVSDFWLSKFKSRRGLVFVSLIALATSFVGLAKSSNAQELIVALIWFQITFNFLFAPLAALLSDYVEDKEKGLVAGLIGLGYPLASLSITLLALGPWSTSNERLLVVGVLVTVCCLPLVLGWPKSVVFASTSETHLKWETTPALRADFAYAWVARLFVQFSGATMLSFLYFFVKDVSQFTRQFPLLESDVGVGQLTLVSTIVGVSSGALIGQVSDYLQKRRVIMMIASLCITISMLAFAFLPIWSITVFSYGLFSAGLTAFLVVDTATVAQLLSATKNRASALGILNLTNTLPAILVPALTLSSISLTDGVGEVRFLLLVSGALSLAAALAVSCIQSID